jgi:tripartite-type tricarboxylate transporter receptor subunit TctC
MPRSAALHASRSGESTIAETAMRRMWIVLTALLVLSPSASAQDYPRGPVRVIVASAAGSGTDTYTRKLLAQISEQVGKGFVVDNIGGAGGIVGWGTAAKAAPDGYTLTVLDTGVAISAAWQKSLPYDPRNFTPITQTVRTPNVIVVIPSLRVATLQEFIALARANPGKYNFGSSGVGGSQHLYGELFKSAAKVDLTHVPYKGGADMYAGALAGDIQMIIAAVPAVLTYIRNGQLRALAVMTEGTQRVRSLPDVPTVSEAGLPDLTIYSWQGIAGPPNLPPEVVNKVRAETSKALADPAIRQWFAAQDAELVDSSPEEFGALIRSELRRWSDVIRTAGIKIE